ncbi:DDE_3 domain-containing protein [Trichonephila clavipes]|nr:DDE_3 domain-containing protein [Trichonephila clavipes]
MTQRTHLDEFLRGRIIGLLEYERTHSWKYPRNLEFPGVSSPCFGKDSKMMVMFSLQSHSRWTFIWRAPDTRYHQENIIERLRFGSEGLLFWEGGIILGSRN